MKNSDKIILDLCGGSSSWSEPYRKAGYDVKLITLPKHDVRDFFLLPGDKIYGILAAPPCTEFSIAKNRNIVRDYEAGMEIVNACLRIIDDAKPKFWALENPVGHLARFLGKPAYSFQPWWFGDPWTKHTMIWGEFNKPERPYRSWDEVPKIPELYIRPGRTKPSIACLHLSHKKIMPSLHSFEANNDASFRAITPPRFAQAFFKANP